MEMQSDVVIKPDYCTCYTLEPGYQRYRLHIHLDRKFYLLHPWNSPSNPITSFLSLCIYHNLYMFM